MASRCVTPDRNDRLLKQYNQNQTPVKLGNRFSRVKEKDLNCLCCGISLYGAGSTFNATTHDGLAEKIAKLLNVDYQRQSSRVCKTCFRRVESLDKRALVLATDLEEFKHKFHRTQQLHKENVGDLCQVTTYVKRMAKEINSPSKRKRLSVCDKLSSVENEDDLLVLESINDDDDQPKRLNIVEENCQIDSNQEFSVEV